MTKLFAKIKLGIYIVSIPAGKSNAHQILCGHGNHDMQKKSDQMLCKVQKSSHPRRRLDACIEQIFLVSMLNCS